jgi:molybdopterin molybdotransferase
MLSVADALARVLGAVAVPLPAENVPLSACLGRTLADDVRALRTQPPFDVSAMDGYAVRAIDAAAGARLTVIGTSAAGRGFHGAVGAGEAVRIFTGARVPPGSDAVLIQEHALKVEDGASIVVQEAVAPRRHIRAAGIDFSEGAFGLPAGRRITPRDLGLAAGMGHATLPVRRAPRVAILSTGDELVQPGAAVGPDQIVASNHLVLAALVQTAGGTPHDLGLVRDRLDDLGDAIERALALPADVFVTLGGASVGDHDLVKPALAQHGMTPDFWQIAMRPGKPHMFGKLGATHVLGLPGNPVSSMVCGLLFLLPLLRALAGDPTPDAPHKTQRAILATALNGNDHREDYVRARIVDRQRDLPVVEPFPVQDSSLLSTMSRADVLIKRAPHQPPTAAGEICDILPMP